MSLCIIHDRCRCDLTGLMCGTLSQLVCVYVYAYTSSTLVPFDPKAIAHKLHRSIESTSTLVLWAEQSIQTRFSTTYECTTQSVRFTQYCQPRDLAASNRSRTKAKSCLTRLTAYNGPGDVCGYDGQDNDSTH